MVYFLQSQKKIQEPLLLYLMCKLANQSMICMIVGKKSSVEWLLWTSGGIYDETGESIKSRGTQANNASWTP